MTTLIRKTIFALRDKFQNWLDGDGTWLRARYPRYAIGRGTYGWLRVIDAGEGATLKIGAFCSIAKQVTILLGGEHHTEWISTYPFPALWRAARNIPGHPKTKGDVIIGNDVWIGQAATILSGVTIGDGAVIAAGALVAKNVAPYTIVGGNPARVIRQRFPDAVIAQLVKIKWWEWSDAEIEKDLPILMSPNVDALIQLAARKKQ
ncbi:MAG: CatB-related O-acetyltransferase [Chloroflexi bacterium]|nr:CatB-related O-acetyltransferase [Chloroflexota bacterium]